MNPKINIMNSKISFKVFLLFLVLLGINSKVFSQVNAGDNQEICTDSTYLNADNPFPETGHWELVAGGAEIENSTLYNTKIYNVSPGEVHFRWIVGAFSDNVVITNNSVEAVASSPVIVCDSSEVAAIIGNDPHPETGHWELESGELTIENSNNFATTVTNIGGGTNTLNWIVSNDFCADTAIVEVINYEFTVSAGEDQEVCDTTATLTATPLEDGQTGYWTVGGGVGNFENPTNNVTIVNGLIQGENSFEWTVINNGCSYSDMVTITNNIPVAITSPDHIVCEDNTTLIAADPPIGTAEWSLIEGAGVIENLTQYFTNVTGLAIGDNVFVWTVDNDGCTNSDTITITNVQLIANAGDNQTLCDTFTTLNAIPLLDGESGQWTITGGSGVIENPTLYNTEINQLGFGQNTLRWTLSKDGCLDYDDVIITSYKNFAKAGVDTTITDSVYQLQATTIPDLTGVWTVEYGNGTFEDDTDPNSVVENLVYGDNLFRWTATYNECVEFDEVFVARTVSAGNDIIVEGDTVQLDAYLPDGAIGEWTVMYGTGTFGDDTDPKTLVWDLSPGPNVFRWTVTLPESKLVVWDEVNVDRILATDKYMLDCKIYPNPTSGQLIINNEKLIISNIEIVDITGRKVEFDIKNYGNNEISIDLSGNQPGIYFLKINGEDFSISERIILQ